jgi:mRNA interferase RelE/StbE
MPSKIYTVALTKKAEKALKQLPPGIQARMAKALLELKSNPRPNGVKKLADKHSIYRTRVGDYRIVYEVIDHEIRIIVIAIGHRREVYRKNP